MAFFMRSTTQNFCSNTNKNELFKYRSSNCMIRTYERRGSVTLFDF